MQTMTFIVGVFIGLLIAKMLYELDESSFFKNHLIVIHSFGLLYYAKVEDAERFMICKNRLIELGVPEEVVNDPNKMEDFLVEHLKLMERQQK